ncbi:DUF4190 domain-containing protein [Streptomyces sp. JJ38]|uniref:DUF4190 domain-containing protein n=1 Tax=Streptomyces sp. JJ38 TaxID=2738128 RepID=UPI001C57AC2F|nr:DUF4190 domain-containing protein [Streptomyces sp. JJ38]MBW1599566.1 DUF4190 domain-containing protein [Streptomyces sp. JJ38]
MRPNPPQQDPAPHEQPADSQPGWAAVPPPSGPNGPAIGALVTSVLFLWPVALVLGFVALSQTRKRGEDGRGLALAGLWVAGAQALATGVLLALVLPWGDTAEGEEDEGYASPEIVYAFEVRVGDCFNPVNDDMSQDASHSGMEIVPCDQPHEMQAYAVFDLDLPESSGHEDAGPWASTGCLEHYGYPTGDAAPGDLTHYILLPSPEGWERDQRDVLCAYTREGGGMLEGSLVD